MCVGKFLSVEKSNIRNNKILKLRIVEMIVKYILLGLIPFAKRNRMTICLTIRAVCIDTSFLVFLRISKRGRKSNGKLGFSFTSSYLDASLIRLTPNNQWT